MLYWLKSYGILLNGWIFPTCGAALERVCACSLRSTLVYTQNRIFTRLSPFSISPLLCSFLEDKHVQLKVPTCVSKCPVVQAQREGNKLQQKQPVAGRGLLNCFRAAKVSTVPKSPWQTFLTQWFLMLVGFFEVFQVLDLFWNLIENMRKKTRWGRPR